MKSRKGFTLIELMVVVLIVAVLAAVLVPLLTARLESARWSEGKAGAGTIATSIRAMYAEQGDSFVPSNTVSDYCNPGDLYGKYFDIDCYVLSNVTVPVLGAGVVDYPVTYTITVYAPDTAGHAGPNGTAGGDPPATWKVAYWALDHYGDWTRTMKP
jgi:prepilin-type N-terminal cleavage/methylation domain-containing protein